MPLFCKAEHVKSAQKMVKHTPGDKLYDGFIAMLAGVQGMVEINARLRSDLGLQATFGCSGCAEQSVMQEKLDVCTVEQVGQMVQALDVIYRQYSQGYGHNFAHETSRFKESHPTVRHQCFLNKCKEYCRVLF
jgi:hypothetical protein